MAAKKAFTKGEEVTVFNSWDDNGTVSFTHAIVYSCGARQMVLTDAVKGNEIGRHFKPVRATEASLNGAAGWEMTFPRLTDEDASKMALVLGGNIVSAATEQYEKDLARYSDNEGYRNATKRGMEALHEPRSINRTGAK